MAAAISVKCVNSVYYVYILQYHHFYLKVPLDCLHTYKYMSSNVQN